jgi:hypothetical protein
VVLGGFHLDGVDTGGDCAVCYDLHGAPVVGALDGALVMDTQFDTIVAGPHAQGPGGCTDVVAIAVSDDAGLQAHKPAAFSTARTKAG